MTLFHLPGNKISYNPTTKILESPLTWMNSRGLSGDPSNRILSSEIRKPLCLAVKSAFTKFTKTLDMGSIRPLVIMARRSLVSRSSGARAEAYVTFTDFTPLPPAISWTASLPSFSASSTNGFSSARTCRFQERI